jgi:hypothetical protein
MSIDCLVENPVMSLPTFDDLVDTAMYCLNKLRERGIIESVERKRQSIGPLMNKN